MKYLLLIFCLLLNGCLWGDLGHSVEKLNDLFLVVGSTIPDGRGLCQGAENALVWGKPNNKNVVHLLVKLDQLPYVIDDETEIFKGGIKNPLDPQNSAWCIVRVSK